MFQPARWPFPPSRSYTAPVVESTGPTTNDLSTFALANCLTTSKDLFSNSALALVSFSNLLVQLFTLLLKYRDVVQNVLIFRQQFRRQFMESGGITLLSPPSEHPSDRLKGDKDQTLATRRSLCAIPHSTFFNASAIVIHSSSSEFRWERWESTRT